MIGKKQISESKDWEITYNNIENIISFDRIKEKTLNTIKRLKKVVIEKNYKRIGYGWSGGKDSLVMYKLLEMSGLNIYGGILILYPTEYPEMKKWLISHRPYNCVVEYTDGITLQEINNNLELLFPNKPEYIEMYLPQRWKVQRQFRTKNKLDVFITGRRTIDGNFCGKESNDYITKSKYGDTFNIIADWTHEEILAFIHYMKIELPPCYFYPNSWRFGTHCWTERKRLPNFPEDNFDELMKIDKDLLPSVRKELSVVDVYLHKRNL